jgi:lysophospholipase L1-like esterase
MPINPGNIMQAFQNETDPAWREKLAAVNVHIRTMPYVIDLEPYFYDAQGVLSTEYAADGLHPDIEGKQLMAQIINMHKDMLRK